MTSNTARPLHAVNGDWEEQPPALEVLDGGQAGAPAEGAAEAAAEAAGAAAGEANAPERTRARVRARDRAVKVETPRWLRDVMADAATWLRAADGHGAPWEEQPVSLVQLRAQVLAKAQVHASFPAFRTAYVIWGHLFTLPLAAIGYAALWVLQSPGRTFIAFVLYELLWHMHVLAQLPLVGAVPVLNSLV